MIKAHKTKAKVDWRKKRAPNFDWDSIADGETHLLKGIEDVNLFRRAAYQAASRRDMRVRTTNSDKGLYVQFYTEG